MAEAAAATRACCALSFKEGRDRVKTMAKYPLHVLPALRCDYRRWHPATHTHVLCSLTQYKFVVLETVVRDLVAALFQRKLANPAPRGGFSK